MLGCTSTKDVNEYDSIEIRTIIKETRECLGVMKKICLGTLITAVILFVYACLTLSMWVSKLNG